MKKYKTISIAMFLSVVFLTSEGLAAGVTKLNDIRAGRHKGYTRLVLDADGARPLKIGPATADGLSIVYEQLELMQTPSALFRSMTGAVARVSHHRQADHSVIAIAFKYPNTAVRKFYLGKKSEEKSAYRLIIDLYPPGGGAVGPGALIPVASAKAAMPAPIFAATPAASSSPPAVAEALETSLPAAESSRPVGENLPKVLKTESASQKISFETASEEPKPGVQPAEPSSEVRMEGRKENLWNPLSPGKTSPAVSTVQPPIRNQFQSVKDKSTARSNRDVPIAAKPAHILASQPPQSGIQNVIPRQAVISAVKRTKPNHESIGLVELTLKFMSIVLSCLVILFLHKANKMATNRYDDIIQLKHTVKTRPPG